MSNPAALSTQTLWFVEGDFVSHGQLPSCNKEGVSFKHSQAAKVREDRNTCKNVKNEGNVLKNIYRMMTARLAKSKTTQGCGLESMERGQFCTGSLVKEGCLVFFYWALPFTFKQQHRPQQQEQPVNIIQLVISGSVTLHRLLL